MIHLYSYQGIIPRSLSEEEIIQKFELFKKGDLNARNEIITHNIRLVLSVANKLVYIPHILDDCFSLGMIGLIKAVDTFNNEKGVKFSTYAVKCITNEILLYFKKERRFNIRKTSLEEIIFMLDYNCGIAKNDVLFDNNDYFLENDNDTELLDLVKEAFQLLNEQEKFVIMERYVRANKTQYEIGKSLNVSQRRISEIENKALFKFRNYIKEKGIHITDERNRSRRTKAKIKLHK